jgi:hypothetical protein
MGGISRSDYMEITESAKDKIIDRLLTKYDVISAADSARDKILASLQALHAENQSMMRSNNAHSDQAWRKISDLESQIAALQNEIRTLNIALTRQRRSIEPAVYGSTLVNSAQS